MSQKIDKLTAKTITSEPPIAPASATSTERQARQTWWRIVAGWGQDEGRRWRTVFSGLAPLGVLVGALLLFGIAWQVPFSYTLDASTELSLDQPFLRYFEKIEPENRKGEHYRWSRGEGQLDFQGIGKRPYKLQMTLAAPLLPNGTPYKLYANTHFVAEGMLERGQKTYLFELPTYAISNKNGNLRLALQVPSVRPREVIAGSTDGRELGFVFYSAKLDPVGSEFVVPPLSQLGWLLGVALLAYALVTRAGFAPWQGTGVALVIAAVLAYIVATPGARPWLAMHSQQVAFAFGWALLLVVLADIPLRRVWGGEGARRWVLSIFGLALAFRLAALLHPHAVPSIIDLGFHLNRYASLWQDGKWWHKITSAEWGNRETYYPHTTYAVMGLFQWLVPDRRLLQLLWLTTLESSRILLVFYLVKRTLNDGRAGIIAAFLMASLPVGMLSLAWGQVANLWGEWLMLVALCLVVVKWDELRRPPYFLVLTATLWASFIVHPGVVLVSGVGFLLVGAFFWLARASRGGVKVLALSYLLAIGLAFGSYHWVTVQEMIPQALESVGSRLSGKAVSETSKYQGVRVGGQVDDARLGFPIKAVNSTPEVLAEGVKGFWREARIYYAVFPLLLWPWSLWWLWRTSRTGDKTDLARRRLFWAGAAWTLTASMFAIVGLLLNLYVRYSLFMLPFIAIGTGVFLSWLWRRQEEQGRSWAARLLTLALCAWVALGTLALLFDRLVYFAHG